MPQQKQGAALSKTREKMLDKAAELFSRFGFHPVGVQQIIEASGVAYQTMYNNFSGKENLAREVLERWHNSVIENMRARIDTIEGVDARLKALFDWHEAWFKGPMFSGCLFERAIAEYGVEDQNVSEVAIRHKKALLKLFEDVLRDGFTGREAKRLASVIVMLLDGATAHARAFHDHAVAKQAWRAVQALLTEARSSFH
ncbi:TetR/AcrR family transcriptional regulator [Burkholderia pseudomallei]|uniref:TetR/AcrR family transcriptional regulator n=1 Tax=Burkholderia pseudomallei TaxID=28450 RepID=UPI0005DCFD70|nr:TetR/AcrR family transcriptional regulator [Burkholderia pseudomallei]CAJ3055515.1 TetR family transcriptional regulator [Burkholderia pseudomallei]CAJ4827759.1 transcriptional regulator, TetR family [Burkholderia pseudomallei]CAJ5619514.1 transcriptional regulator, TetR family [Burkholderia pseudomallei]CAJ7870296.1 transcriptional regulator, TetR family [Burkholderia pseudomallei]CAJ7951656.1 transcriptional regulator, TetR family [Burkholderia pseudomallei]